MENEDLLSLVITGQVEVALNFIHENTKEGLNQDLLLFKAIIMENLNNLDDAKHFAQQAINGSDKLEAIIGGNYLLSRIDWLKGNFDISLKRSIECVERFKDQILEKNPNNWYGMLLNQVGLNYSSLGEYEKALKTHEQAFDLLKTHGHPFTQSIIQNNIATDYLHLGDYGQAIGILNRSIEISKKLGDVRSLALGYNNLAYCYISIGEIGQAQKYQTHSLTLYLKIGNKRDLSVAYKLLAEINYQRNQLKDAFESYHKSLEFQLEIGNELEISLSLFGLIEISIELDQTNVTKKYLNQLLEMDSHNPIISNMQQMAKAINMMVGRRLKDLVQAQDIFDHLLQKDNLQNHLRIKLLVYYCKFLFVELRISSNKEVMSVVQKLIDDLIIISKQQLSHIISIHSMILKSKLLQVEGKYLEANQILEDLRNFCHDKDLAHMTTIVENEIMLLDKFVNKWISIVESGENLNLKIHESEILSYLDLIALKINKI